MSFMVFYLDYLKDLAIDCIQYVFDLDVGWLVWLFTPILATFLLPILILIFLYGAVIFLYIYRARRNITEAYHESIWDAARVTIAMFWDAHGYLWHGYEIYGLDKIPEKGPAVLVYYHGALPVDFYYIISKIYIKKRRVVKSIGDRFLFKIPGLKLLLKVTNVSASSREECIELLNDGFLLGVAPGGVREAQFGDEYYGTLWGNRCGFAQCAIEAKVPIIPMFTQNCRESFRSLNLCKSLFRKIYESTKIPLVPIYGGFPVKMRTYIGDPIPFNSDDTPRILAKKVEFAVQSLINKHQRIPGNVLRALLDRF